MLGLNNELPDDVHYQLVHRTASAVIEAQRFGAHAAVMLVHSFSPENRWFEEFLRFAEVFGVRPEVGRLARTSAQNRLPLYLGWVHGDERFLLA